MKIVVFYTFTRILRSANGTKSKLSQEDTVVSQQEYQSNSSFEQISSIPSETSQGAINHTPIQKSGDLIYQDTEKGCRLKEDNYNNFNEKIKNTDCDQEFFESEDCNENKRINCGDKNCFDQLEGQFEQQGIHRSSDNFIDQENQSRAKNNIVDEKTIEVIPNHNIDPTYSTTVVKIESKKENDCLEDQKILQNTYPCVEFTDNKTVTTIKIDESLKEHIRNRLEHEKILQESFLTTTYNEKHNSFTTDKKLGNCLSDNDQNNLLRPKVTLQLDNLPEKKTVKAEQQFLNSPCSTKNQIPQIVINFAEECFDHSSKSDENSTSTSSTFEVDKCQKEENCCSNSTDSPCCEKSKRNFDCNCTKQKPNCEPKIVHLNFRFVRSENIVH